MKIGILTQPLRTNYGGLLQAYALQKVLKNMGHEVLTVDIVGPKQSMYRLFRRVIGRTIKKYILGSKEISVLPSTEINEKKIISQNTDCFISDNISLTKKIESVHNTHHLTDYNFDAYVVGSDQVWRPIYSLGLETYFLDFLADSDSIKRIAYAASFGTDQWELSPEQTTECGPLLRKFDAVSVREASGIDMVKQFFKCDAHLVLDPTLLLEVRDYISLVKDTPKNGDSLMMYVLDESKLCTSIVKDVAKEHKLEVNTIMPKIFVKGEQEIQDCIYPSVEEWIKGFMNASFVVTDSFHGTVFSILFNKPFITIGNEARGLSRFSSLLNLLGLEDRLVSQSSVSYSQLLHIPIDYSKVNSKLDNLRKESLSFLINNLS